MYPASTRMHDDVVTMLALLWHCPAPPPDAAAGPGQGLTLVHFSAQPEPFLTQNIP